MNSGIVLAAGMSTRMGQPKALLDWGGEPLLGYQVRQLIEAGLDEVIVVTGYRSDEIYRALRPYHCRVMLNARYQMGRAGSLRIGAKAVDRDAETIVIVNVDQPCTAKRVSALLEGHDGRFAASRPAVEGRHGHPIAVSGWLRAELLEANDDSEGLRGILHRHAAEIQDLPGDDADFVDLDTPDDYREAQAKLGLPA